MNNKGFAITGVLYTIFILFIMVLLSILSGLNQRMILMEKSISIYTDSYKATNDTENNKCNITTMNNQKIAECTGKYVFGIKNDKTICITYLKKGTSFTNQNIGFITKESEKEKRETARNNSQLILGAVYELR